MPFNAEHDNSKQKKERRLTTYKQVRRSRPHAILATNFPGEYGRKFVHKLAGLGVPITLVEKQNFSRDSKKDLKDIVTLVPHTDIFFQMLSNHYDFIDLDLCGGLSEDGAKSILTCSSWKVLMITVTDKFRSRWGTKSVNGKVHIQTWIMDWCEKNGWGCQLTFSPAPYRRVNKNEALGIPDGRGPHYFTFIITR